MSIVELCFGEGMSSAEISFGRFVLFGESRNARPISCGSAFFFGSHIRFV